MAPRKKKTDIETEEAAAVATEPEEEPVAEIFLEPIPEPSAALADEPEPASEPAEPPPETAAREPRKRNENILTLNDQERGFTQDAGEEVKWKYLATAMHKHLILTGIVSGVEYTDSPSPICVIDYEGVRILIPGREMFMNTWPENESPPLNYRLKLAHILGATVDFVLAGVDVKNRAAVASRRTALQAIQERYYGTGRVKEGILIACRVIGVNPNSLSVEALGVDTNVRSSEVAWEWFSDIGELYSTGDIVVARVIRVRTDPETGRYHVRLSIKAASSNPEYEAARKLVPGSNYYGVVTGVGEEMIFVRLQIGVNVKTPTYSMKTPPQKHDTVSFRVKDVTDSGTVIGIITRVIRSNRLR